MAPDHMTAPDGFVFVMLVMMRTGLVDPMSAGVTPNQLAVALK